MKRSISLILIILTIALTFASCGGASSDKNVFETLNNIFTKDNSLVNIEVETVTNGESLTSVYTISKETNGKRITYSIEKLSTFEEINGAYVIPDSYKTTLNGVVLVSNGNIIEQSGETADLDFTRVDIPNFEFDESYFSNVIVKKGVFTANVKTPSSFLGKSIICSDMTVSVTYSEISISKIDISYVSSEKVNVKISYSFE